MISKLQMRRAQKHDQRIRISKEDKEAIELLERKKSEQLKDVSQCLKDSRIIKFFKHERRSLAAWAWGGREIAIIDLDYMRILQRIKGSKKQVENEPPKEGEDEDEFQIRLNEGISGFTGQIECIDVAQASKDIAAYGTLNTDLGEQGKVLVVYGLKDFGHLRGLDEQITQHLEKKNGFKQTNRPQKQNLIWQPFWKATQADLAIDGFLNSVALSPFGDLMTLAGSGFISVWSRDSNLATRSFGLHILCQKEPPESIYCQSKKEMDLAQIIQVEYTIDGRAFICLDIKGQIDVFYNAQLSEGIIGGELAIESGYKSINLDHFDNDKQPMPTLYDLSVITLPQHRKKVVHVQVMNKQVDILRDQGPHQVEPIKFLTITVDNCAHLWVEDMSLRPDYQQSNDLDGIKFQKLQTFCQPQLLRSKLAHNFIFLTSDGPEKIEGFGLRDQRLKVSPMLYGKENDKIAQYKMLQSEKVISGMIKDNIDGGSGREIVYVVASGQRQVVWQVNGTNTLECDQNMSGANSEIKYQRTDADLLGLYAIQETINTQNILESVQTDEICMFGLKDNQLVKQSDRYSKVLSSPHYSKPQTYIQAFDNSLKTSDKNLIVIENEIYEEHKGELKSLEQTRLVQREFHHLKEEEKKHSFSLKLSSTIIDAKPLGFDHFVKIQKNKVEITHKDKVIKTILNSELGMHEFTQIVGFKILKEHLEEFMAPHYFIKVLVRGVDKIKKETLGFFDLDMGNQKMRYWTKRSPIQSADTRMKVHFKNNLMLLEMSQTKMEKHMLYLFKDDTFHKELDVKSITFNPHYYPIYFSSMLELDRVIVAYQAKIEIYDLDFNLINIFNDDSVNGLDQRLVHDLLLQRLNEKQIALIINKQEVFQYELEESQPKALSFNLWNSLQNFYERDKSTFIFSILVKLHQKIVKDNSFEITLDDVTQEMERWINSQVNQVEEVVEKKKDPINSMFGGDDSSSEESVDIMDMVNKKPAQQAPEQPKSEQVDDQAFIEIRDSLIEKLQEHDQKELANFVRRFSRLYHIDFYSDPQATQLLKHIFLRIEEPQQDLKNLEMEVVPIDKMGHWDSRDVCKALFSVNQDEIMNELEKRFEFSKNSVWAQMRLISLSVWFKESRKLRDKLEPLAKIMYRRSSIQDSALESKHITPAETVALWYIIMNKKSHLVSFYEREHASNGDKIAALILRDFDDEKNKKVVIKNAGALKKLTNDRLPMAAVMYLLGHDIVAAVQILEKALSDPLLAILVCRMMLLQWENTKPETAARTRKELDRLYQTYFIDRGLQEGDAYLQAIGLWGQQKYIQALNSLQVKIPDQIKTDNLFEITNKDNDVVLPNICTEVGASIFQLVQKLKKEPRVQAQLNQGSDSAATSYGADQAALMDDFFGPSSSSKKEEKKEAVEKVEISIDESVLLTSVLRGSLHKNQIHEALFILREHRDLIQPQNLNHVAVITKIIVNAVLREKIEKGPCKQMLKDIIQFITGKEYDTDITNEPLKLTDDDKMVLMSKLLFRSSVNRLLHKLDLYGQIQLATQVQQSLCPEVNHDNFVFQIEQMTLPFMDYVYKFFQGGFNIDDKENQSETLKQIIECITLMDRSKFQEQFDAVEQGWHPEQLMLWQYTKGLEPVKQDQKEEAKAPPPKKDAVADMFGGSDSSSSDDDVFEAMKKKEKFQVQAKPAQPKGPQPLSAEAFVNHQKQENIAKFSQRLRLVIALNLSLLIMAFKASKYSIFKDLVDRNSCLVLTLQRMQTIQKQNEANISVNDLSLEPLKNLAIKLHKSLGKQEQSLYEERLYEAKEITATQGYAYMVNQQEIGLESYDFSNLWMKYIMIDQMRLIIEKNFLQHDKDRTQVTHKKIIESIPQVVHHKKFHQDDWNDLLERIEHHQKNHFWIKTMDIDLEELLISIRKTNMALAKQCQTYFIQKLNVLQKQYICNEVQRPQHGSSFYDYILKYFFKTPQKLQEFWDVVDIPSYGKHLNQTFLSILARTNTSLTYELEMLDQVTLKTQQQDDETKKSPNRKQEEELVSCPATQVLLNEYLGTGIEIFKAKSEQIHDFTFDKTSFSDNIAIGLMTSGIREFPLKSTLECRNRVGNGLQLIDEENLKWEECLHRYDQYEALMGQQEIIELQPGARSLRNLELFTEQNAPIVMSIDSMFANRTLFGRKQKFKVGEEPLPQEQLSPPTLWNGQPSENQLKATSRLDIDHDDPTYAIESHPHLPLYVTGNRRGILCTWSFNQQDQKSLVQFMPSADPRNADIKKATIQKLKFNSYGDKLLCSNMEGNFSIYQVECQSKAHRKSPVLSFGDASELRINDFDLLSDTVVACLSQKKSVRIYDTMLPYNFGRQAMIQEFKLPSSAKNGGNILLCNQRTQSVYVFNTRTGAMTELDLRKNLQQIQQYQMSQSSEIKTACLSANHDSLITGYQDGSVKIHRVTNNFKHTENQELPLREKIMAFPYEFKGKKGVVTSLKINSKTGALFASSQAGILKLLRTSV